MGRCLIKFFRILITMIVSSLCNCLIPHVGNVDKNIGSMCNSQGISFLYPRLGFNFERKMASSVAPGLCITPAEFPKGDDVTISRKFLFISLIRGTFIFFI